MDRYVEVMYRGCAPANVLSPCPRMADKRRRAWNRNFDVGGMVVWSDANAVGPTIFVGRGASRDRNKEKGVKLVDR